MAAGYRQAQGPVALRLLGAGGPAAAGCMCMQSEQNKELIHHFTWAGKCLVISRSAGPYHAWHWPGKSQTPSLQTPSFSFPSAFCADHDVICCEIFHWVSWDHLSWLTLRLLTDGEGWGSVKSLSLCMPCSAVKKASLNYQLCSNAKPIPASYYLL